MTSVNPEGPGSEIPTEHEMEIRVRYRETDAQGHVHHSNYLNYFEIARAEMLRESGFSYRELEDSGVVLVVVKAICEYRRGAKYDDLLTIRTRLARSKGARIVHRYEILRGDDVVCTGETTVASTTREGKVARLPKWLCIDVSGESK